MTVADLYLSVDAHVDERVDKAIGIHQEAETPENTEEVTVFGTSIVASGVGRTE